MNECGMAVWFERLDVHVEVSRGEKQPDLNAMARWLVMGIFQLDLPLSSCAVLVRDMLHEFLSWSINSIS